MEFKKTFDSFENLSHALGAFEGVFVLKISLWTFAEIVLPIN